MAEQWKKGDAVWYWHSYAGWRAGRLEEKPRGFRWWVIKNRDSGEYDRIDSDALRPRDPDKKGKDRPTAKSEAKRG